MRWASFRLASTCWAARSTVASPRPLFLYVSGAQLGESVYAAAHVLAALDGNGTYLNMSPKCEPQLGKRGLYRPTGGKGPGPHEFALLWVLNQSNGARSLLDIAARSGIPFPVIRSAADDLIRVGLLTDFETKAQRT